MLRYTCIFSGIECVLLPSLLHLLLLLLLLLLLQAEGKLEAKLHEMYRWGKQYGWEPVVHVNGVPQPPPGPGVVGLAPPVL
jgi:hypothetical protein